MGTNYDSWKLATPPYLDRDSDDAEIAEFYEVEVADLRQSHRDNYEADLACQAAERSWEARTGR